METEAVGRTSNENASVSVAHESGESGREKSPPDSRDTIVQAAETRVERTSVGEVFGHADLAVLKERDHHARDMEYRTLQLQVARYVVFGVGLVGAFFMCLGYFEDDDTAWQFGSGVLSMLLGLALGFLFPRS